VFVTAPALVAVLIKANAEGRLEAYRREISSEMRGSAEAGPRLASEGAQVLPRSAAPDS